RDRADRGVAVEPDDQSGPELFRRLEVARVADVQEVEAAIGKHDALAAGASRVKHCREGLGREDLIRHRAVQGILPFPPRILYLPLSPGAQFRRIPPAADRRKGRGWRPL